MIRALILFFVVCYSAQSYADDNLELQNGIRLFSEKNYQQSAEVLQKLAETSPSNGVCWFNLGNAYYMLGQYEKAFSSYKNSERFTLNLKTASKLYQAKALLKLNNTDEAEKILVVLGREGVSPNIKEQVDDLLLELGNADFERGMQLYEKGQYLLAQNIFQDILEREYWEQAEFMLALCYMKLDKSDEALKHFKNVSKTTADAVTRKDAEFFIKEFEVIQEEAELPDPLSLYVKAGGGYNTNVYVDGKTDDPEGKPEVTALAGVGYRVFNIQGFSFNPAYSFMWDEIIGDTSLRFVSHTFELAFGYDIGKWFFRLVPQLEYQHFDFNADLYKAGSFFIVGSNIGDIQEIGVTYNLYKGMTGSTYYDYLKGYEHAVKLFWGIRPSNIYIGVNYGYYVQDIGDIVYLDGTTLPFGYKAHGPELRAEFYPSDTWSIYLTTAYLFKKYNSLAMPDNKQRDDKTLYLYTEIQKTLVGGLNFFVSFNAVANSSTLGSSDTYNENYTQFRALGGLKWELRR